MIHAVLSESVCSVCPLTPLVRPIDHVETVAEGVVHHAHWLLHGHLRRLVVRVWGRSVREKSFVDLKQCSLIVYEQVKDVRFVFAREVTHFNPILCKLC